MDPGADVEYVDEFSPLDLLCTRTLKCEGMSLADGNVVMELRSLYFEWQKYSRDGKALESLGYAIPSMIINTIQKSMANAAALQTFHFDAFLIRKLSQQVNKYQLSTYGKFIERYRKEMFFQSPPKEKAEQFLDECLYDSRYDSIRKSLEDYITGKTDIIL